MTDKILKIIAVSVVSASFLSPGTAVLADSYYPYNYDYDYNYNYYPYDYNYNNNYYPYDYNYNYGNNYGNYYGNNYYDNYYSGNYSRFYVQTNSATNIHGEEATLNGYVRGYENDIRVWFQYDTIPNRFSYSTGSSYIDYSGNFSKGIDDLSSNRTYYYRAVAENENGYKIYGQTMTFRSSYDNYYNDYNYQYYDYGYNYGNYYSDYNYYGSGALSVSKRVINLTSGNLNWQSSVGARYGDVLSFSIILQANGQNVNNVYVRDYLPSGLQYQDNVTFNTGVYYGNIFNGVSVGNVYTNQPVIISYQAKVVGGNYNVLNNSVTVTSNQGTRSASASVLLNQGTYYQPVYTYTQPAYTQYVAGASTVGVGVTNDIFKDSFLLPLSLIVFSGWLYFSGKSNKLSDWIKKKYSI